MANNKRYGNFEYGDVYLYDPNQPDNRGAKEGRLVVDQDNAIFYVASSNKASRRIPHDRVNYMLANKLIEFDHEESETYLIDYMMRIQEHQQKVKEQRIAQYQAGKEKEVIDESRKLVRKTKRNARLAKFVWVLGCLAIVGLGVFMAIPQKEPAPAEASIAGIGVDYGIAPDLLDQATYMTAIGNGPNLYGLVFDSSIIESGQQNSNESTVKENVMVNADVSQVYPIHLRPLYYDRSSFYQSQLKLNDAEQGSSAVCLQNPNGYSLGKPANELVLLGGQGMSSVVISSPDPWADKSAQETVREIEQAQQEAYRGGGSSSDYEENVGAEMPEAWNGYDYADIDGSKVAASYWYTTDGSKEMKDLHRRVVVWDITRVYNEGANAVSSLEPVQLNYQDKDSNFYNPVIAQSPASYGAIYWVGYTKKAPNGAEGFYIRQYENADDLLVESYDNTLSTYDLTGNDFPISNYTLNGDRLFFEQQGAIWVIDLSKIQIKVDENSNQRTVKKENPIKICSASDIRPSVTRDEEFIAKANNATTVPVAHYQVTKISTDDGIQYGISFIESESGNLVFQPCLGATAAASTDAEGTKGDSSSTTGVSSGNQTAIDRAEEENARRNGRLNSGSNTGESDFENSSGNPDDTDNKTGQSNTENNSGLIAKQSAYTSGSNGSLKAKPMADEEEVEVSNRILIRPGSPGDYQIICFCVRGEMFYWIEQSEADNSRKLMESPVYYKNDAVQAIKEKEAEEEQEVDPGLQADYDNGNTQVTGGDTAANKNRSSNSNAGTNAKAGTGGDATQENQFNNAPSQAPDANATGSSPIEQASNFQEQQQNAPPETQPQPPVPGGQQQQPGVEVNANA